MTEESKNNPHLWAIVTVSVTIITCIGTVSAAILPDLIKNWRGTPTPTSESFTTTIIPIESETPKPDITSNARILLSEDFEDGNSDGWNVITGTWDVIQDSTGNYVYRGKANSWGLVTAGSENWKNYALEFKVKGIESLQQAGANDFMAGSIRINLNATACQRYVAHLHFGAGGSLQSGKYGETCSEDLAGQPYQIKLNEWYLVKYEAIGSTLKLYVNDKLISVNTDGELSAGYIGLSLGQDDIAYFDDVRVTEITK